MEEKKFNFVYITTNLINGMQYVGEYSTEDLECTRSKNYLGSGKPYFKNALNFYGKKNFKREILEFFPSKKEAFDAQEKYIKEYNTLKPNGYNLSPKGGHGPVGSWSDESKDKLKKSIKNRKPISEETRLLMSNSHKGILLGRTLSQEAKDHLSQIRIGKKSPNKGKTRSKEANLNSSKTLTGKSKSETHKKNISLNNGMRGKGYLISGNKNGMYLKAHSKEA